MCCCNRNFDYPWATDLWNCSGREPTQTKPIRSLKYDQCPEVSSVHARHLEPSLDINRKPCGGAGSLLSGYSDGSVQFIQPPRTYAATDDLPLEMARKEMNMNLKKRVGAVPRIILLSINVVPNRFWRRSGRDFRGRIESQFLLPLHALRILRYPRPPLGDSTRRECEAVA